jgi:hypothetical protein
MSQAIDEIADLISEIVDGVNTKNSLINDTNMMGKVLYTVDYNSSRKRGKIYRKILKSELFPTEFEMSPVPYAINNDGTLAISTESIHFWWNYETVDYPPELFLHITRFFLIAITSFAHDIQFGIKHKMDDPSQKNTALIRRPSVFTSHYPIVELLDTYNEDDIPLDALKYVPANKYTAVIVSEIEGILEGLEETFDPNTYQNDAVALCVGVFEKMKHEDWMLDYNIGAMIKYPIATIRNIL